MSLNMEQTLVEKTVFLEDYMKESPLTGFFSVVFDLVISDFLYD